MAKVEAVLRAEFPGFDGKVTSDTTALDVDGWDSLAHIGIIMSLEKTLEVEIDPEASLEFQNIGELIAHIEQQLR